MENNKSTKKNETILIFGAGFGGAFGAAFGAIFKSIDMGLAISIGIALGVTTALVFGKKIVQLFGNPKKNDSNEEKK
jgi:predicted RND superfamily exporter protein